MENMETNKDIFIKRFKSFLWRLGSMVLAAGIAFASDNVGLLHLAPQYVAILGLVLGEISKQLNSK